MKQLNMLALVFFFLPFFLQAQEIDENEIQEGSFADIEFINYVGPHDVINTLEEIKGIGSRLGSAILSSNSAGERYQVTRINPQDEEGMGADILELGSDVGVDHIDNLNLIISGYLIEAFEYDEQKATIIANYITRYNAFYRQNIEYFGTKFKISVMGSLEPSKAGLDVRYSNWPGKTQILIPLRDTVSSGESGQVDSDEISNEEIAEEVLEEEEGLEDQKEIVNIREEEIAEEEQAIQDAEEELDQREEEIQEEIQELEEELEENSQTEETNENSQEENNDNNTSNQTENSSEESENQDNTETEERLEELREEQEQIQEEREELDQAREDLEEREENLDSSREEIAEEETERSDNPPQDQSAVTEAEIRPVYFLQVDPGDEISSAIDSAVGTTDVLEISDPLGQMIIWDLNSSTVAETSALNSIRGRTFQFYGDSILVLAGRQGTGGAVRLYLLSKEDLSPEVEGTQNIFAGSKVVQSSGNIYAVIEDSNSPGSYVLAMFDGALELKTQGALSVLRYTPIEISDNVIFVQGANGDVLRLNATTLAEEE